MNILNKKYNPIKVNNPSLNNDGYSIFVNPRQSISFTFEKKSSLKISLNSDFLVLETVYDEGTKRIYNVSQKYNLEKWSNISTVFLGNVVVKDDKDNFFYACIYLDCKNFKKKKFITIINPKNNLIRVNSSNVLHTVYFSENDELSFHNRESVKINNTEVFDELCNQQTYNDVSEIYNESSVFCSEPRNVRLDINPYLKASKISVEKEIYNKNYSLTKEYHYYDCFSENFIGLVNEFNSSSFLKINNVCHFKSNPYTLIVVNRNDSLNRNDVFYEQDNKDLIWDSYFLSITKNSLINPSFEQIVDLNEKCEKFYIEIPNPSLYDKEIEDGYWHIDRTMINKNFINIRELPVKYFNSVSIQRFAVDILKKSRSFSSFIDFVKFHSKSFNQKEKIKKIIISVSLWKEVKKEEETSNKKHFFEVEMVQHKIKSLSEDCNVIVMNSIDENETKSQGELQASRYYSYNKKYFDNFLQSK